MQVRGSWTQRPVECVRQRAVRQRLRHRRRHHGQPIHAPVDGASWVPADKRRVGERRFRGGRDAGTYILLPGLGL